MKADAPVAFCTVIAAAVVLAMGRPQLGGSVLPFLGTAVAFAFLGSMADRPLLRTAAVSGAATMLAVVGRILMVASGDVPEWTLTYPAPAILAVVVASLLLSTGQPLSLAPVSAAMVAVYFVPPGSDTILTTYRPSEALAVVPLGLAVAFRSLSQRFPWWVGALEPVGLCAGSFLLLVPMMKSGTLPVFAHWFRIAFIGPAVVCGVLWLVASSLRSAMRPAVAADGV